MVVLLVFLSLVLTVEAYHPSPAPPNIAFNATFGDTMVLQQSPAKACVYGVLGEGGTGATVKISAQDMSDFAEYEVQATVQPGSSLWNACLRPQKAGAGKFTIAATCVGCANTTAA